MERLAGLPLISVVMPMLDAAGFVDASVSSILSQTFDDFELIVIDDGSSDASQDLVRRRQADDPRVRLLAQPHAGISAALNHACQLARGRWIARMDADDIARPDRLARQIAVLEDRGDIDVLGSAVTLIDASGAEIGNRAFPACHDDIVRELQAGTNAIAHPSVVMRSSALLSSGGYASRFDRAEDYELWLRMLKRFRFANLPEPLVRYRIHATATSEAGRLGQKLAGRVACATHRCARSLDESPPPAISWRNIDRLGLDESDRIHLAVVVAATAIRHMHGADGQAMAELDEAAAGLLGIAPPGRLQAIAEAALVQVVSARMRDASAGLTMASLARALMRDAQHRRAALWLFRSLRTHPGGVAALAALASSFIGRRFRHAMATRLHEHV